LQTVV